MLPPVTCALPVLILAALKVVTEMFETVSPVTLVMLPPVMLTLAELKLLAVIILPVRLVK